MEWIYLFRCSCCCPRASQSSDPSFIPVEAKSIFRKKKLGKCDHIAAGLVKRQHKYFSQLAFQAYIMNVKKGVFVTFIDGKIFTEIVTIPERMFEEFTNVHANF